MTHCPTASRHLCSRMTLVLLCLGVWVGSLLLPQASHAASTGTKIADVFGYEGISCIDTVETRNARFLLWLLGNVGNSIFPYPAIAAGFRMKDPKAEGEIQYEDAEKTKPKMMGDRPMIRCDVEDYDDVTFAYPVISLSGDGIIKHERFSMKDGDFLPIPNGIPMTAFQAKRIGDRLCVMPLSISSVIGVTDFFPMACKHAKRPSSEEVLASCYISPACAYSSFRDSASFFPLSGPVVQCVKETLDRVFVDTSVCEQAKLDDLGSVDTNRLNLLPAFQNGLRTAVQAALVLYVILFGIKIALGQDLPQKRDIFIFIMKFILVLYFSVGIYAGTGSNGQAVYHHGVKDIYDLFMSAANSFSVMLMSSANATNGVCNFGPDDYATTAAYHQLVIWDSLDCRVAHYLGIAATQNGFGTAALISMIIPGLFSFQIIFAIFCIILAVFLLSVTVYIVHVFIIATIAITIVIYFAPLFVPMALFKATKQYFDSWLKTLLSFALQPAILMAFMGIMFVIFDDIAYPGCQFEMKEISIPLVNQNVTIGGRKAPSLTGFSKSFKVFYPKAVSENSEIEEERRCARSFGYKMSLYASGGKDFKQTLNAIFFTYVSLFDGTASDLFNGLLLMTLFMFLFYYFVQMLGGLAADLTGGPPLAEMAIGPTKVFDAAKSALGKLIDAKTGGAASKAKDAAGNGVSVSQPKNATGNGIQVASEQKRSGGPTQNA